MSTLYAPPIPSDAIRVGVLAAATAWQTEAVQHNPTAYDDGDETAAIWVAEIIGRHPRGWNVLGREALVIIDLATMTATLTEETS